MRKAALRAETDASLAKQAAVSKKQATRREAIAVEEQQKIEAETRVEEGTTTAPWDTIIVKLHWLHQW